MAANPELRITPETYLAMERAGEFKSEYYGGYMYAMSGASYRHVVITGNLAFHLRSALDKSGCSVVSSDLRVCVAPSGLYTYPDVVVICGKPQFVDNQHDTLINPTMLIEVLSPTTEAYDRGFKSSQYRKIESLREYALVSQQEPRVEVHRRDEHGQWVIGDFAGLETNCHFSSVDCEIPLAAIYQNITFEEAAPR